MLYYIHCLSFFKNGLFAYCCVEDKLCFCLPVMKWIVNVRIIIIIFIRSCFIIVLESVFYGWQFFKLKVTITTTMDPEEHECRRLIVNKFARSFTCCYPTEMAILSRSLFLFLKIFLVLFSFLSCCCCCNLNALLCTLAIFPLG